MSDIQAVPVPNNILETYQRIVERPEIKKETTKQERIARLSSSDDFKAFVEEIDEIIQEFSNIPVDPMKDTPESVGWRYLASNLLTVKLKYLRDLPDRYAKLQKEQK